MGKCIYNGKEWDSSKFPKEGSAECALRDILWYNGYFVDKDDDDYNPTEKTFCDLLKDALIEKIESKAYLLSCDEAESIDSNIGVVGTEEHFIWMLLVGMFGDWGTSIRFGWIDRENFQTCIDFLDNLEASMCCHS